jgi:hypothetical protein
MIPIPEMDQSGKLQGRSYRLREETRAIVSIDGKPDILSVPAGSVLTVIEESLKEPGMLLVAWGDKTVKLFRMDLMRRGDPVRKSAAKSAGH